MKTWLMVTLFALAFAVPSVAFASSTTSAADSGDGGFCCPCCCPGG
jgi:hypothetical protein